MTPGRNRQLVIDAWKAFPSRDATRIAAFFTEDAEWLAPKDNATAMALGYGHHMVGRDAIIHFITVEFRKLFVADVNFDFRGFYADENVVVVEERMRATLSSGRRYEVDYIFVFQCADGRIERVREYMDTLGGHRMIFGEQGDIKV